MVDALAGRFDDVVQTGELFRIGWERAGRPVATTLCRAAYAVAMVHGMRGDEERRAAWVRVTIDTGTASLDLAGWGYGWATTFDALLALHRGDLAEVERRLAADIDDPAVFGDWNSGHWRPWVRRPVGRSRRARRSPGCGGTHPAEPARCPGQPDRHRNR
jgi:hypothetical protein